MRNLFIAWIFLLLLGCASKPINLDTYKSHLQSNNLGTQQQIAFYPPKLTAWNKTSLDTSPNGTRTRTYVPQNETTAASRQAFYETYFPMSIYTSKTQLLKEIQAKFEKSCPDSRFKVVSTMKTSTTYTSNGINCDEQNDRFVTGKIMQGNDGLYMLEYMAISNQIDERSIQFGMNSVMSARLTS